jgi:GNAT superfamily N-acetyltransferase
VQISGPRPATRFHPARENLFHPTVRRAYRRVMDIRQVDVNDIAQFRPFYEIMRAAELSEGDLPFWTEHEAQLSLQGDDSERATLMAAYEDGVMVGGAVLFFPLLDNTDKTWGGAFVAPENRRRGIGSALIEDMKRRCTTAGRSVLLAESTIAFERREDHPYRRFAEKHGFALASVEVTRVLQLPVDDALVQQWIDDAAARHSDYTIETHGDQFPEELIPSLCDTLNQLALDAPTGDIEFEEERTTPEVWKQRRAKLLEQGRHPIMTVALDHQRQVVAMTMIAVPPEDKPKAYQWGTVVHRAHRGHRLGMAVKAHNLRALQEWFPDRRSLWTTNEEHNGPMLDINIAMGFEPLNTMQCFQWKAPG